MDKYGRVYVNFSPAVSRDALKAMRQTIRGWRVQLKNDKSLADLSAMLGPILRGWQQYYGHFDSSALKSVWRRVNRSLIGWLMRKHKKLAGHKTRAAETLKRLDVAPSFYPATIGVWSSVMPCWAVVAAARGAKPSVERSAADRRAAA